uniref:Secreted protein n=1 Tax=Ixodes ricinus TaxID=34613 RepID=A0A6B0UHA4_IXORI
MERMVPRIWLLLGFPSMRTMCTAMSHIRFCRPGTRNHSSKAFIIQKGLSCEILLQPGGAMKTADLILMSGSLSASHKIGYMELLCAITMSIS